MITKQKLYKTAVVSITIILMLVSTAGAVKAHGFGNVILTTDNSTSFVDFLKLPGCGCDGGCDGGCGCGSFMDHSSHSNDNNHENNHDNNQDNSHGTDSSKNV